VVKVYDSDFQQETDMPYILMEYIQGKSLIDCIKENLFSLEQKLFIVKQIAAALAIVHKFGVLHRDVKPSNILVTENHTVKLTDFGIAKVSDSSLTMTHEVLGSPAYMPPETFTANKLIDTRSDIFSLGILFYELVTGVKPFHGETVTEMMNAIQNARPVEPLKIVPDLPEDIQKIMGKMLRKNPEKRFQGAGEIVEALEALSSGLPKVTDYNSRGFLKNLFMPQKIWS
jgi:serine/threonine-protein kinase